MNKIKAIFSWFLKDKKRIVIAVIIIGVLIFGYGEIFGNKSNQTQIQTAKAEKGTIVSTVSASGSVISSNITSVTTQTSGLVKKVYVKEGDNVAVGQKLAEIELDLDGAQQNASAYSNYVSAVNSLNSANNNLRSAQASLDVVYDEIKGHDNDESLTIKETRTKTEVAKDNAYNSIINTKANLTSSSYNLRLNSPVITAPTSGKLISLTIAEGMSLSALTSSSGTRTGQRVASIVTEGKSLISVNISEIDVPNVEIGQKATVTFDSITDKTFSGQVVTIDRVGSTISNVTSYPAIIALDTNSDQILTNMAVTVNIITQIKNDVLLIPTSAVQLQGTESSVRVIKNGVQENVIVQTGLTSDSQTEITSGLFEGDEVITSTTTSTSGTQTRSVFSTGGFGGARFIGR
ncbi:MAG: hypothetical protein UT24_C0009G0047 [Candidatus Woesebacteria bacterium GW2011_GWB1_39_12]|uniref:Uncharacterized protein n=2 Tax=Candidatus Woeseibacteriota TaxID=1752722 RepID=A0A0G0M5N1_9BACT|nr:MAG: hypothetical protein UT23_C0002G0047 [Candidatus Woesebacteria bacterium GW2011_GWA1_39_12]KKR00730.1 MAG: hypothetical protein UT24_C0009G0047 [Candidatus Woesebacteria bacterium GW2011_GWB1_39_12]